MDLMELWSGKTLEKENERGNSDNDPEKDVRSLLEGNAIGGQEEGEVVPIRKTGRIENPPPPNPSPCLFTMDISSVRYWPASVMTSADQTSARGLPRSGLETQRSGRFYNIVTIIV